MTKWEWGIVARLAGLGVLILIVACAAREHRKNRIEKALPGIAQMIAKDIERSRPDIFKNVTVLNCYDGDTCKVELPGLPAVFGKKLGVRLLGIDTPEIRGKCAKEKALAQEAKAAIWKLVSEAKRIDLTDVSRGKYFRIVARIKADGVDATDHLLAAGLGVPYMGGTKEKDWCR